MGLSLLLKSLQEFYLSFCPECLYGELNIISILLLSLSLLFIFFVGIPSIPTFWKKEHTQKRTTEKTECGPQRQNPSWSFSKKEKFKTLKIDSRNYHSKVEEERELISFLKSPLGRNHDSTHFRQLLCPDPSCDICNNATTEINRLFSKALEGSTPSVSPVVSTAPVTALVTEPSFNQSSAFPGVPPGELIPSLTEPSPSPSSVLPSNSMTTLSNFLSHSPSCKTLPTEPSSHSESEFSGHHPPPQTKHLFSSTLTQYDFHQKFPDIHSTKISSVGDSAAKLIYPRQRFFLSPDEHDSVEQYSYPKTWEDNLKQEVIQFFWGLPSLHSESLLSAAHVPGDYTIFNSISTAFTGQESPRLPYILPPSLPKVQPQLLPQTMPLCHYLPLTQLQPPVHRQSPLPILPSDLIHQTKVCGVYCLTPQNESECLTSSDIEQLEWNVLKKKQEGLWGLPSLVQSSWEACCPSAPTSPYCGPSKANISISIDHFEFPLSVEFREKFEHHLRKRLIQHRWGLPHRIHDSLSLMKPRCDCSGSPQPKCCYGLSWISMYKAQDSEILNRVTPSASFYKKGSEMFQLSEDEKDSLDSFPKGSVSDSDSASDKDVGRDFDMKRVIRQNVTQKQLVNFLKVHLSKKFGEISEGHLPGTVQNSQHSIQQTLLIESNREIKQRSLSPSVGGDYCLNTSQEPAFLQAGAREMLEDHDTNLPMKALGGLSAKVLESTEDFKSKGPTSHGLINPHSSSSTKVISEVSTKSGAFTPLGKSSESLHSDQVGTENSAPGLNLSHPATSPVGKEGRGIQWGRSEEIQMILEAKPPPLPVTNTIRGKTSQRCSLTGNIQPSKLPARQANREPVPKTKSVNSNDGTEMQQATNRDEAKPPSMPTVPGEIVRAEELDACQSVITSKPGISQQIKKVTTVITENPPSKISDPAPNLSELRKQLIAEMNLKLESRKHSQAQGQPLDMSSASDSLTNKAPLTPDKCVPSVDTEVHQVLHVQSEDSGVSLEKQQEPWLPKQALRSCQDQNSPPSVKKDIVCLPPEPTGSKCEEFGAGDARLRISQTGEKRFPSEDTTLEDVLGSKSFHSLTQTAPPDSLLLNKMKSIFQRLCPSIKCKMQETTQEMGSHTSSAQGRGPLKSKAVFTGAAQVHRVMSDTGKFPEEKQGRRPAVVTTCSQEPLPSAVQFGKPVQKGAVQAQAEPVQGRPFHRKTPYYNVTNKKSDFQAAISDHQRSTSIRRTGNKDRSPSKAMAIKGHRVCQKHPQSVCLRGTVPHSSPTSKPQADKGPPAVLTTAGGTAFKNHSPRFRHTMLLYNFQGETFPTPK